MTCFHQGNKLVSNQKVFFCFLFVSHQIIILSLDRHHFSSLAYIYMHKYF